MDQKPWEVEPKLRREYLCELGQIIRDVRHGVLDLYDPDEGDGPWSLGCRAYERTINVLGRKAESSPWLKAVRKNSLYFLILLDGVPLRFYKGSFDHPPERTLRQDSPEARFHQITIAFDRREWVWRISVEPEQDGRVFRITLAQYDRTGNFRNPWEIPLAEPIPAIASLTGNRSDSVILEKPSLLLRHETIEEGMENASGE